MLDSSCGGSGARVTVLGAAAVGSLVAGRLQPEQRWVRVSRCCAACAAFRGAIEPVTLSRLCSRVAMRASSRSRSAASARTVSASRGLPRHRAGWVGLPSDGCMMLVELASACLHAVAAGLGRAGVDGNEHRAAAPSKPQSASRHSSRMPNFRCDGANPHRVPVWPSSASSTASAGRALARITLLKTLADSSRAAPAFGARLAAAWLFSLSPLGYDGREPSGGMMSGEPAWQSCWRPARARACGRRGRRCCTRWRAARCWRMCSTALRAAGGTQTAVVVGPDHDDGRGRSARACCRGAQIFVQARAARHRACGAGGARLRSSAAPTTFW